jgi:hypothetical protein
MISALLALHEALSQSLERWTVYGLAYAGGPSCHLRGPFGRRANRITIVHHASEFGLLVMHCGGASLRNCAVDGCSVPWRAIGCRCVSSDCGRHSRVSGPQSWLLFVALGIWPIRQISWSSVIDLLLIFPRKDGSRGRVIAIGGDNGRTPFLYDLL